MLIRLTPLASAPSPDCPASDWAIDSPAIHAQSMDDSRRMRSQMRQEVIPARANVIVALKALPNADRISTRLWRSKPDKHNYLLSIARARCC
jgi:hypothetical protein